MKSFNHKLYVNLMRESGALAKQYRIDCGLEKRVTIEEPKEVVKVEETPKELDIEELKAQYKEKFGKSAHPATKIETLKEKLQA